MKVRKLLFIGFILALTAAACGGGGVDEEEPSATTEAVATATDTLAVDSPTPRPAENIPSSTGTSFSYCLLDAEEVDVLLDEFVTGFPGGNLNCTYQTDSGRYLRFEPGIPEDLRVDAGLGGVEGESIAGIGDEAAWFDSVEATSHHFDFDETVSLGVLSLREGNVYLRTILNTPELDSEAQLELATEVAALAITRLPEEEP